MACYGGAKAPFFFCKEVKLHRPSYSNVLVRLITGIAVSLLAFPMVASTFRIAVGIDPDTLDPAQMTTTTVANMVDYVVESLVTIDQEGKVIPQLAESWEVSGDGLAVTFKLREGVFFHDGTPFDAETVKWNIERILDPQVRVPLRAPFAVIDKVEVVDPLTVKLVLKKPSPPLVAALTMTTAGMISPASIGKLGNEYTNITHPVGTGPYKFVEYVKGQRLVVAKFENYWGRKPFYDEVVFKIVPEAVTRESLLLAGQVDMVILPPVADVPALERNPRVKVLLAPSDRTIFIAINNQRPPFDDVRVRQALNYAVDKEAIIKGVLFGAADPMDAPMAPSLFGYCPIGGYEYNPDKARELLREAGVAHGTKVELLTPTGRYLQDFQASQAIAGYLREVGLDVTVRTMDWPSYVATIIKPLEENEAQLHYLGWAPSYLDAAQQMRQFQSSQWPPNGLATTFYKNPEVDRLIEAANSEVDPEKRAELYCEASKLIWEDAPWIFLWVQRFPIVYSSKVTNISYLPNEKFYAVYAEPAK